MAKILLHKDNLFHNLNLILKQTNNIEKIAIVLKDNAYGHGIIEISSLLKEFGIKKVVVKNLEEAIKIKKYFDYILVLSNKNFNNYKYPFHFALNAFELIKDLPDNINIHIKVDTGMNRNGILPKQLKETFYKLIEKNINITGVFTHHKNADNIFSKDFQKQNKLFSNIKNKVKEICKNLSIPIPSFHSCNSSALFRHKTIEDDFVRVGIATYGYLETNSKTLPNLKPVMSLWANKISTRVLKKGQSVGYAGTYISKKDMDISTYDIGYGDGFLRLNEKQHYITPKGFKVLGRVSMDFLTLNSLDGEVCLFEDARTLAKLHNTISYEIITTLSKDIKREIVN